MFVMPADYQYFDLRGTHYALGLQQGAHTERFEIPAWWPPPADQDFARACADEIALRHPPLLDELRGYADAQRLSFDELLRGVCRRSMRLRARLPHYPEGGCSSAAWVTAGGHVRVGRNYDFHPVQRVRQRLRLKPRHGYASLGTRGSVPGGRYDGVNARGLFICLHVALADEPAAPRPGLPFHLLPRLVLETCTSTPEAVDLLTRAPHLHSFIYLIADADGSLCVVEAHPERVRTLEPRAGFIAATNHYRHPDMQPLQHGRRLTHSHRRLESLVQRAADGRDIDLADHSSQVCGHHGGHTTLWSLTADLSARTIAYTRGAPCQAPYEPIPWPE